MQKVGDYAVELIQARSRGFKQKVGDYAVELIQARSRGLCCRTELSIR